MARAGKVLKPVEVIAINRQALATSGGLAFVEPDNCLNRSTLEWVLEAINGICFGVEMYPSIIEKAAAICWYISTGHVFRDANKRTSMAACRLFLEMNGYEMKMSTKAIVCMALRISRDQITFDGFAKWLRRRTRRTP